MIRPAPAARALLAIKENLRLLEVPLAPGANRFETKRVGGGVQNFDAIKVMKFSAS